jgi:hypothetical protein
MSDTFTHEKRYFTAQLRKYEHAYSGYCSGFGYSDFLQDRGIGCACDPAGG